MVANSATLSFAPSKLRNLTCFLGPMPNSRYSSKDTHWGCNAVTQVWDQIFPDSEEFLALVP